jgi:hypothetical protein
VTSTRGLVIGAISEPEDLSDWEARSTAPGVLKAVKFRTEADLGEDWINTFPEGRNSPTGSGYQRPFTTPVIDSNVALPGSTTSMRLTHPSGGTAGACGRWDTHFGGALSNLSPLPGEANVVKVGEGEELWYQYRVLWDAATLELVPNSAINTGMKLSILGDGSNKPQIVHQGWYNSPLIISYDGNNPAVSLYELHGGIGAYPNGIRLQGGTAPYCNYPGTGADCFEMVADEWVTFTTQIQIGSILQGSPFNGRYWDQRVRIWAKRYGQPEVLIIDYDSTQVEEQNADIASDPVTGAIRQGRFQIFNNDSRYEYNAFWKLILLSYMTDKTALAHTPASAYYDEVIISTQEIAQPRDFPEWREGKTVGEVYTIANTESMGDPTFTTFSFGQQDELIDAYTGNVVDWVNSRWLIVNGGGHGQSCGGGFSNSVVEMDFWADEPVWVFIDEGSPYAKVSINRYYGDGRPAARHTYSKGVYIPAGVMPDGLERAGHVTGAAGYAQDFAANPCSNINDGTGHWAGGSGFELCRLDPADWFAHNTFDGSVHGWELQNNLRNAPQWNQFEPYSTPAQDRRTGDIYWIGTSSGYSRLFKWTAATDTWSAALVDQFTNPTFIGGSSSLMWVDTIRNRLVNLWHGGGSGGLDHLLFVDLNTYAVTRVNLPVQGGNWGGPSKVIVHDTDNDLYCFLRHEGSGNGNGQYAYRLYGMTPTGPSTGVITDLSGLLPQDLSGGLGFHLGFIPDLHCLVWLGDHTAPIRFMPTA